MQPDPPESSYPTVDSPEGKGNDTQRSPMPAFAFNLANPLMKALLRSPFHGWVSKSIILLTFTGRKTGKRYSTPVGYVRKGSDLIVFTHSKWWRNLTGGAAVSVRLEGRENQGWAAPIFEPGSVKEMVQALNAAHGTQMSQRMGFWVRDLEVSPEEIVNSIPGVTLIRIRLT